jgi:hypothetical protein
LENRKKACPVSAVTMEQTVGVQLQGHLKHEVISTSVTKSDFSKIERHSEDILNYFKRRGK